MAHFALPTSPDLRRDRPALPGDAAWWAFCAATALALGAFSSLGPHRVWGAAAAFGYTAAAVLAARGRSPRTAGAVAVTGAVLLPLVVLLAVDRAQLEVDVVARSAGLLLSDGTSYLERPTVLEDFNPYLPGMAAFGTPEAVAGPGPLTDPRLWMGAAFLGAFALALPAGARRQAPRWLAACPLVALPLAVGGVDLPVAGLMCLGLARAGQGRAGRAGLALGLAAALKWTAWPAVPVALALLATASGEGRRGSRAALRCGLVALLTAAARLALGLLLAIALMPATRFGYLVHPLVLAAWALARQPPAHPLRIRERVRDLVRRRKQASR